MAKALVLRLDRGPRWWRAWWLEFCWLDSRGDCVVPAYRLLVSPLADLRAFNGRWGVFDVIVERAPGEQEPDRQWEVTAIYQWEYQRGATVRQGSASEGAWPVIRC